MKIFKRGRFIVWLIEGLIKKYYRQILLGLFVGIIIVAFSKDTLLAAERLIVKQTVFIGVIGDYSTDNLPESILQEISYGLTAFDQNGKIAGGLASSWEATDSGKTFLFHLQDGATWHDGKKVTASDINYNIKGVTMEIVDPLTLRFSIPEKTAMPFLVVASRPVFRKGLVGIGPYKVSSFIFKGGSFLSLTLTPKDLEKSTKHYKFYKTEAQALLAYKIGEVDRIENLATKPTDMTNWANTSTIDTPDYTQVVTLFFNLKNDRLKEKSFRQGLTYGIPDLLGERAYSPIAKTSFAYTDAVKHYAYDEKQAKKLIDQTASGTASATLTINTFTPYLDTAQKIADSWTALGIKTDVKIENTIPSDFQVLLTTQPIAKDPDQYPFWHSKQRQTDIIGYVNLKIDKLLEDGREELDQEARKKLYVDFQKRLVEDLPAVYLLYPKAYTIIRK